MTGDGFFSVDSMRGMWVLLIDDDRSSRELLTDILEHCGALVTAVASAETALGVMRHVKPDVLVMSLFHSQRDARWLIKEVRARKPEEGGMVPAIVITGTEPGTGFEGHLIHPFDPWQLCRLITNIINTA
ncbi:MAG TPA: response regulator [Candidatus Limnocylindria bacterium]|nr:response regulator [Candidatus Limnocylindria bacterium]